MTRGEHEPLAPVIPLFGGRDAAHPAAGRSVSERPRRDEVGWAVPVVGPLGDERAASRPQQPPPPWQSAWSDESDHEGGGEGPAGEAIGDSEREVAETNLLKKLRTRQLSLKEARAVIAERALARDDIENLLDDFQRRGYLDDAALAEQVVRAGVERKGQGRQVLSQTLAKRGIPRDVADAALAAMPDDDAERALEFARQKARAMSRLDEQTALRRLTGQLARRGYPGSVASAAAKEALREVGTSSGVRFR